MMRAVAALALLAVLATSASAGWRETFNVWERGYVTCPVHAIVDMEDSLDITPPIIDGDTLDVRGFMIGVRPTIASTIGYGHVICVRYRQAGDDGWYRWNEWLTAAGDGNAYAMPLIGTWQPVQGATWTMGLTQFMPLADVRLLRLINPSASASMQTVTVWFIDQHDAEAADWSKWTMP